MTSFLERPALGGACRDRLPSVNAFTFVDTLTWSQPETHGSPPSPRHGHVMVAAGTKLFIHGGLAGDKFFDDLHCIDIGKPVRGPGALYIQNSLRCALKEFHFPLMCW